MNEQKKNKQKVFIILGILVLVVIIVIFAVKKGGIKVGQETNIPEKVTPPTATTSPEELAPSKSVTPTATVTPEVLKETTFIATGTSLITKDNKVVTPTGEPVKLNVIASSPQAPTESAPVKGGKVTENANNIKVSVSTAGFSPNSFKVKEGQLVNFVLTSTDNYTHVFAFDDQALMAAILGVAGHETRVKSWNAPKKGTYTFRCDLPGHKEHGEVGTMIVE